MDDLTAARHALAGGMTEARKIAKGPELFRRKSPATEPPQFCVLRRWNSHTPTLMDVLGGGYFLRWNGKGTIIDPGCGFVRMFQLYTPYGFEEIDMIIATHDHVDHSQDFGTFVTLLREYNKWKSEDIRMRPRPGKVFRPHILDLLVSHGVAAEYNSVVTHPENAPFLRTGKVLPPKELETVQPVPKIAYGDGSRLRELTDWQPHLKHAMKHLASGLRKRYSFGLHSLPAKHKELLGDNTSMGVRFDLLDQRERVSTIAISGDTGVRQEAPATAGRVSDIYDLGHTAAELAEFYRGADLLVLHVGSMERVNKAGDDLDPEPDHLGSRGVVEILKKLVRPRPNPRFPKAVVLTEWGYEFGRLGLYGRTKFTQLVAREAGLPFFAAVDKVPPESLGRIPIIPADIALRFRLPDLAVWCSDDSGNEGWAAPEDVRASEGVPEITYVTIGSFVR